jgi:hypothetical protein
MALQTEECAAELSPTDELLADRLGLPGCVAHDLIRSLARLIEVIRRDDPGTPFIRSGLYDIFERVEHLLPDDPRSGENWAEIRAELFRMAFASRRTARREDAEPDGDVASASHSQPPPTALIGLESGVALQHPRTTERSPDGADFYTISMASP